MSKWVIIDDNGNAVAILEGSEPKADELPKGCTCVSADEREQYKWPESTVSEKRKWSEVRRQRNRLLEKSDWTQLPDAPTEMSQEWRKYRQKLRDLTATIDDIDNVIWPEKPNGLV